MSVVDDLLPAILGAGGAGFVAACAQAYKGWRDGAEAREGRAVANLEKWGEKAALREATALEQLDRERRWGAYWRSWAGILEYTMFRAGVALPPRPPEPDNPADHRE